MNTKPMVTSSSFRNHDGSSSPDGHPVVDRYAAVAAYENCFRWCCHEILVSRVYLLIQQLAFSTWPNRPHPVPWLNAKCQLPSAL